MKMSRFKELGYDLLTEENSVLLNGKEQPGVVFADDVAGFIDISCEPYEINGEMITVKRKFGSVIFLFRGQNLRDKGFV